MAEARARCKYPIHGAWPPKASFLVEYRGRCREGTSVAVCGRHLPMAVRALNEGCGHKDHEQVPPGILHVRPIK